MTPLQKSILNAVKRRPMTLRELQNNLQVDNSRLRTTVSAMVATGELSMRNGTYVPGFATYENAAAPNTIPCTLVKLAARFGFASRDDGEGDIFIPGRALHGAMPNDKINVKLFDHPRVEGSSEGEVVEVTVPNNRFAGTVCLSEDGRMAVEPDGCRDVKFLLAKQGSEGVHLGDKVGFLITHRGNRHSDHRAAVVEKFGSSDYASECAKAILYGRSVRQEFPPEVLEEARAYDNATIDPAEAAKRLDLRGIPIFTIDSAETKDIDDAISLQKLDDGYELGVHIADVSHYVRPGSALNEEAFERATSIYYADKVIPMLPTQLSNGICSLNEGEDRLALSCIMRIDEKGAVRDSEIVESVIRSTHRMTYTEVTKMLDGDGETCEKYADVKDMVSLFAELTHILKAMREKRGSIDLDVKEAKIMLDKNGEIVIPDYDRSLSHEIIEQFMVLANETVAEYMHSIEMPFVYRIHEKPSEEKASMFREFAQNLGLKAKFSADEVKPYDYQKLLKAAEELPIFPVLNRVMLRSMQKARYSPVNAGHFGLASACYCHFTSPIRRYPDLCIHRIIKEVLDGRYAEGAERYNGFVSEAAVQSSECERRAAEAEREVDALYTTMYMSDKIGENYEAVISGVAAFGLFAELPNTIEGFIPLETLEGEFEFIPERFLLKGNKESYSIGEKVRVKVESVDFEQRRTRFSLLAKEA